MEPGGSCGARLLKNHLFQAGQKGSAALCLQRPLKPPPPGSNLIFEEESAYNYIQVVEASGTRYLLLNETLAVHSIYNPKSLNTNGTWDYFIAAPFFNPPPYLPQSVQKVAILGLAAGTTAHQFTAAYGPIPIDGVEIDPEVVAVGRHYFDMNMPNLNVIVDDARFALTQLDGGYQVIGIDAYRPPYIPWQLTTTEFFQEVRMHLSDDGVVVVNVGRTPSDRRLVEAMAATLLTVFPTVHTLDIPGAFNSMLIASVQPTSRENLTANVQSAPDGQFHPLLKHSLELTQRDWVPTIASNLIFTDDRAPVEWISDSIVLQYGLLKTLEGQLSAPPTPR